MSLNTIRQTYTNWAPYYDATHAWTLLKREDARLALDVQAGDHVLDVACGTGLNFPHLRELVGGGGRIIGVDLTPAMLDIARRQVDRYGWTNVEVREADAAHLPFPDASFDKAICTFAMNIIPAYEQALAEIERVLTPGGRFVVLDIDVDSAVLRRLGWLLHTCAVESSHRPVDALRHIFANVQVNTYFGGLFYIAVARKR